MKVVIFCPHGVRTGGPEAIHQLADALNRLGCQAVVFYLKPGEAQYFLSTGQIYDVGSYVGLSEERKCDPDYERYLAPSVKEFFIDKETVLIFPEVYAHLVPAFAPIPKVLWWLSVDNSFSALGCTNLNFLRYYVQLHACQSLYAKKFVDEVLCVPSMMLTDYIAVDGKADLVVNKNAISINPRSNKVIFDIYEIGSNIGELAGVHVHYLQGLSREGVDNALASSYVYLDLGSFPGRDRMPREAVKFGAIPLVLGVGGGMDYGLPKDWIIDDPSLEGVSRAVIKAIREYSESINILALLSRRLSRDQEVFEEEVALLFRQLRSLV